MAETETGQVGQINGPIGIQLREIAVGAEQAACGVERALTVHQVKGITADRQKRERNAAPKQVAVVVAAGKRGGATLGIEVGIELQQLGVFQETAKIQAEVTGHVVIRGRFAHSV